MRTIKPFRYYGGKSKHTKYILPFVEGIGKTYVEPFCGSAAVFFAKKPHPAEVLNDINDMIINFFRVLRDHEKRLELIFKLLHTPYARKEFELACNILQEPNQYDDVDKAWAWFVITNQSYGGLIIPKLHNWCRNIGDGKGRARYKSNYLYKFSLLDVAAARLMDAIIDNRDAIEVMQEVDDQHVIFYLDPPYPEEGLVRKSPYQVCWDMQLHNRLLDVAINLRGYCLISSSEVAFYKKLLEHDWAVLLIEKSNEVSSARRRHIETLWINPRLWHEVNKRSGTNKHVKRLLEECKFHVGVNGFEKSFGIPEDDDKYQMVLFGDQLLSGTETQEASCSSECPF